MGIAKLWRSAEHKSYDQEPTKVKTQHSKDSDPFLPLGASGGKGKSKSREDSPARTGKMKKQTSKDSGSPKLKHQFSKEDLPKLKHQTSKSEESTSVTSSPRKLFKQHSAREESTLSSSPLSLRKTKDWFSRSHDSGESRSMGGESPQLQFRGFLRNDSGASSDTGKHLESFCEQCPPYQEQYCGRTSPTILVVQNYQVGGSSVDETGINK